MEKQTEREREREERHTEGESCSFMWIKFGQGMTRGKRIKQLKCVKRGQGRGEGLKDVKNITILCIMFQT
jgi:hypothetical protein